jgi:CRISPR/Cas system CMR subunit Cmr4 (Cas7 group RAMP superfamily)
MTDWRKHEATRNIAKRLVVTGILKLTAPAHLGNGDTEGSTDMPLLRDALEDRPLLMGTSLAGALRAYLLARTKGYKQNEQRRRKNEDKSIIELLFGGASGDEEGDQSPLIIDDALGDVFVAEIRDGVRIDASKRIAQDKFKYDGEFLPPGTSFALRFELLLNKEDPEQRLSALGDALAALENGEIAIGARKTRGFGRCRVNEWKLITYNLSASRADLLAWLTADHDWPEFSQPQIRIGKAADILGTLPTPDARNFFGLTATFSLASPLLIRSEEPLTDGDHQPDFAHLHNGRGEPIVSGTSLAGVLRARTQRIVRTLRLSENLVDELFGKDMLLHKDNPTASRLIVEEAVIQKSKPLVQNRVAIDRFTGGAFDTALFAEAPEIGGEVELKFQIHNPKPSEIGLLLLLLKDLWTSDLPLGGASNIGRGRLRGIQAVLTYKQNTDTDTWRIQQSADKLIIEGDRNKLEAFVQAIPGGYHA